MNRYQEAIQLLKQFKTIYRKGEYLEEKKLLDLSIECLEEKSSEFEYEQTHSKEYLEAQHLFDKINGHHEDHEIFQDYALEIYWNDSTYLVMYLDDGQVTLNNQKSPYNEVEFGPEDSEYTEIIKEIVKTGLTKIN